MPNWSELSHAFRRLAVSTVEGIKSSDGAMKVDFDNQFMYERPETTVVYVEFFAYCMPDMDKHHRLGPFGDEESAWQATRSLLQRQWRFINVDRTEAKLELIEMPFVLLETEDEARINQEYFDKKSRIDHGICT